MKITVCSVLFFVITIVSCNSPKSDKETEETKKSIDNFPYITYNEENLFPGDGSLLRVEDGVSLEDGRVVVVDQENGLRIIEKDGSNRPFGNFKDAGFFKNSPEKIAGPNGLVLEYNGNHLLMCDVSDGKIYRTNIALEKTELIYEHNYGVNAIYSDKTGAIWFTQCAENTNMGEMFMALNLSVPTGAIFRMADLKSIPTKIADSLYFSNGITMDKDEKVLYVSETMMDRVKSFNVDVTNGKAEYSGVVANVGTPDNIIMDNNGNLIVASPANNQVIAFDFKHNSQHIIFDASTKENQEIANEWFRRSHLGLPRAELVTPNLFNPLPGLLTGMFFSKDGQTLYIANLGNDLVKLEYK
ncbi:MAG: SMP-30/gluconolactonase/LRE family protein [Algicola sp.]|nr:SMP-30/gluconolactonase/LRE family protein [Algicola sp.]